MFASDAFYAFRILDAANWDGDSFNLSLDLGFNMVIHRKCRLHGCDTPELNDKREDFRSAARIAKSYVAGFIELAVTDGGVFVSENYVGKFGRPLGDILVGDVSLRAELIQLNLGVPYAGENKSEIQHLHLANIDALKERGDVE